MVVESNFCSLRPGPPGPTKVGGRKIASFGQEISKLIHGKSHGDRSTAAMAHFM